ncbi:MAG: hypothetical protein OES18_14585, partial [Deltaproteobacteria bacterium]|nr:hypothetical protein [Deltaproteobacteria bacterium]
NPETLQYERSSGYQTDEFMNLRVEKMRQRALEFHPIILSARIFSPNNGSRKKAAQVAALYNEALGKPTPKEQARSVALVCFATIEWFRVQVRRLFGRGEILRQPPSRRVKYNTECSALSTVEAPEIPTGLQRRCYPSTQ